MKNLIRPNFMKVNFRQNKNKKNMQEEKKSFLLYEEIYDNGIYLITENEYSITIHIDDISYQLCSEEQRMQIFIKYCEFLNSLEASIDYKVTLVKKKKTVEELTHVLFKEKNEQYDDKYRQEMNDYLTAKINEKKNAFEKKIFITFTQKHENQEFAERELFLIADQLDLFARKIGSTIHILKGEERKELIGQIINNENHTLLPKQVDLKLDKRLIKIDDKLNQTLYLNGYPAELSDECLTGLMEIDEEITLTVSCRPIPMASSFDLVKTKMAYMDQQKVDEQRKALNSGYDYDMLPYDLTYSLDEAKELLDSLQSKSQKLFEVTVLINFSAENQDNLNKIASKIKSVGRRFGCTIIELAYLQKFALNTILPIGKNHVPLNRLLATSAVSALMPFSISEMLHENGNYYGINSVTKNLTILDRKKLMAPNGFVLGTPGSGKSFSVKREIVNVLLRNAKDEVIVIDPESEYQHICSQFDGQMVRLAGNSNTCINPMDINSNYGDDADPIALKTQFLISLCELITGGILGLSSQQKTIIDRVCRKIYQEQTQLPTLKDFYTALNAQPEEEAKQLAIELELYTEGSLALFSKQTNVDLNKRLVIFDIKDLGKQLKPFGMLVVLDQIWNRITLNRESGIRTWLYIDELQLLFTNEYSENYFFELWSRARKWGAIPTGITQNVETLLLSDLARRMLSNSDFVVMFNQAKSDRSELTRLFDISEEQEKYVLNGSEGTGLMVFGDTIIPFEDRLPKETKLYQIMTTKPGEEVKTKQDYE
ncbi:VirB4-like conjugal transfer ATPase, CD1110 family [Enterococcus mundtii]|uniref:VirB4-like conjugal transfer ATPase, CD1110 family n=1 Tax=Enterococcus mundtii TaxID=53346 RepID=UPI000D3CCAAC|nr:ATP-binding protein [Enterococcus mundtii]PTO38634.1 conjugal transfer protein [Enterococcus mundtii]